MKIHTLLFFALALSAAAQAQDAQVRYDLTGSFAADTPVSAFSAPFKTFDLSFAVPAAFQADSWSGQPFNGGTAVKAGSYTFDGHLLATARGGFYGISESEGNASWLTLNTPEGLFGFNSRDYEGGNLAALTLAPDAKGWTPFATGDFGSVQVEELDLGTTGIPFAQVDVTGTRIAPVPGPSTMGLLAVGLVSCGCITVLRLGVVRAVAFRVVAFA